jgi:hypothetical protein
MGFASFMAATRQTYSQRSRNVWVAGLLTPACPDCQAVTGEWCDDMHPVPAEMVRIDRNPPRLIHSTRIAAAVNGRHASRTITLNQFAGGPVAAGLIPAGNTEQR